MAGEVTPCCNICSHIILEKCDNGPKGCHDGLVKDLLLLAALFVPEAKGFYLAWIFPKESFESCAMS